MSRFGVTLLRDLTPEEREVLNDLVSSLGGALLSPMPASAPLPEAGVALVPNLMQGPVQWGAVVVDWHDGVPLRATRYVNGATIHTDVPPAFWQAVMRNSPRERWLQWVYLAGPESDYIADAHNGNGEDSWGPLQVNRVAWPQFSVEFLTTYDGNIQAAEQIYALQGWGAWFNSARLVGLL